MTQEQTNNNNKNIKETPSKDKKKEKNPDEDLSEEDLELLNQLEQLVNILSDSSKISSHEQALDTMSTTIKTATTSMTSVPKPLKFLSRFYDALVSTYESWMEDKRKLLLSDILSILSMTHGDESNHLCLKYRLSGSQENLESWGHEYIRYLSLEIGKEFNVRQSESNLEVDDLLKLALEIVPFFLKHNAEADAVDLLYELESIEKLPQFVDKNTYERVGLYMAR
jgi:26S proteasome regulatory subunit N1